MLLIINRVLNWPPARKHLVSSAALTGKHLYFVRRIEKQYSILGQKQRVKFSGLVAKI